MDTLMTKRICATGKVLNIDDGRRYGDPIIVTLAKGFAYCDAGVNDLACHVQGFSSVGEIMRALRNVETCNCNRCTS